MDDSSNHFGYPDEGSGDEDQSILSVRTAQPGDLIKWSHDAYHSNQPWLTDCIAKDPGP